MTKVSDTLHTVKIYVLHSIPFSDDRAVGDNVGSVVDPDKPQKTT